MGLTKNFTVVLIEKEQSACKIFNPKRFDGSYPLCERKYAKKLNEDNIQVEEYVGFAKVVVSLYTPIRFRYVEKGKLTTNCFNDIPRDKAVQALMNQEVEDEESCPKE